jgi:GMP synthase (glutamine-hydrolysing)
VTDPAAADGVSQAQDDDRVEAPEADRVDVPATPLQARPVLVVDFGAQYAQLIARRVREAHIYSEVVPHTMPVEQLLAKDPAAIVLSGGPSSVYEEGAPDLDAALLEAGVPVFGMCYGFQSMVQALGGTVAHTGLGEYAATLASSVTSRTSSWWCGMPRRWVSETLAVPMSMPV